MAYKLFLKDLSTKIDLIFTYYFAREVCYVNWFGEGFFEL